MTIGFAGKEGLEPSNQLFYIICDETVNLDYPFGRKANTALFYQFAYFPKYFTLFQRMNNQLYFNYTIFYSIQKINSKKN